MTIPSPPKPNTQALSWFYGEHKKDALEMKPKYQRNPIWSIGQKCFLIDSIMSGCPLPQVFLNITTRGKGKDKETIYEVVDGQQRLRAIIEFLDDQYSLIATTARSYPISEVYRPHIGKKYSALPMEFQDAIWNYPLAVQELRGWDEKQIRSLFRRLNYVVERLNKQELRHSQYFGEFVDAVEKLSNESFWDEVMLFTRRDSQRMKDVEYISELFVLLIAGPRDQNALDTFYAEYDVVFPEKSTHLGKFKRAIVLLATISDFIKESRFRKKADFYALFGAVCALIASSDCPPDLNAAIPPLKALAAELDGDPARLSPAARRYYSTVIEGPNKVSKRRERINIVLDAIKLAMLKA